MTQAERYRKIVEAISEQTAQALVSKKASRKLLISEGIYTARGKLRVEYGGKGKKGKAAA